MNTSEIKQKLVSASYLYHRDTNARLESVQISDLPFRLVRTNDYYDSSFNNRRISFNSGVLETYIPHLEITITVQSNDLTHHQPYTKKQQVVYELIRMLHEDKGLGYRKISKKLNSWGIKTQRGNKWFNTSVSSVLKRKHQRDVRIEKVRKQEYQIQMDKLKLKYFKSD